MGNFRGAINDINKVVSSQPKNGGVIAVRGVMKIQMGDIKGGCKDLKQSITLGYSMPSDSYKFFKEECI